MNRPAPANPWLPPALLETRASMRLFCLPYAGSGASAYRLWASEVPPSLQVCAVQLPGRESRLREQPFTTAEALVPELIEGLRPFLDRPFAVFGHSMGALLGFELARALRALGLRQPAHLFLSGHRAPHLPRRGPDVHRYSHAEFIDELRKMEGTPEEVLAHEELMQIAVPILRADFELCAVYTYTPGDPLDMPLSIFGGAHDPTVPEEDLHPWNEHTRAGTTVRMFPGNHLYLKDRRQDVVRAVVSGLGL